jgi:bacteriorhodopsin
MNNETYLEWLLVLITIILIVGLVAVADQRDSLKQQAVDKGFAEWQIISGTKETEFKWKEPIK